MERPGSNIRWDASKDFSSDIFRLIGRTPLMKLERICKARNVSSAIFGKLEFFNPTGSLKDRIYHEMVTKAIERGELKPGMEIIEASTGNAGIACSFVGSICGFKVTVVMPRGMSQERVKMIRAFGGSIVFTEGGESDVDLDIREIRQLVSKSPGKYWWPDQFSNPDNPNAHFKTTGPEIWQQTGGQVDCFLASTGPGGTLTGVARFLKQRSPSVKVFAVEPSEAPLLSKRTWGSHRIEGIGDGFVPRNLDLSLLEGVVTTTSEEAVEMAKRLALEEGIFCGISSGCNVAAAIKTARRHPEFRSIVTMINDSGQRYFSTELCWEKKEIEIPMREHPLDEHTLEELNKYQSRWEIID